MIDLCELRGEALDRAKRLVAEWKRLAPRPRWPNGTTFREPSKEVAASFATSAREAVLSCGAAYVLGTHARRSPDPDDLESWFPDEPLGDVSEFPPVLWSFHASLDGRIWACPRVANLCASDEGERLWTVPAPSDRSRASDVFAGVPVGLHRRYFVGRLGRRLEPLERREPDGYGW